MPAGAIIGATAISAGASLLGARSQGRAATRAADAQVAAADRSAEVSREIYQDQTARQEPFRQLGLAAINPMADLLGLDYQHGAQSQTQPNAMSAFMPRGTSGGRGGEYPRMAFNQEGFQFSPRLLNAPQSPANDRTGAIGALAGPSQPERTRTALDALKERPGYQFRLQEGNDAYEASAAARGMGNSGAQLRALARYNQDYASNEYDKELNRLSMTMGGGQMATQNMNQAAGQYGQNAMNAFTNAGNARASGYAARGAANAGAISGVANAVGGGLGMYGGYRGWWGG